MAHVGQPDEPPVDSLRHHNRRGTRAVGEVVSGDGREGDGLRHCRLGNGEHIGASLQRRWHMVCTLAGTELHLCLGAEDADGDLRVVDGLQSRVSHLVAGLQCHLNLGQHVIELEGYDRGRRRDIGLDGIHQVGGQIIAVTLLRGHHAVSQDTWEGTLSGCERAAEVAVHGIERQFVIDRESLGGLRIESAGVGGIDRQFPGRDELLDAEAHVALALVGHVGPYPELAAGNETGGVVACGTRCVARCHKVVRQADGILSLLSRRLTVVAAARGHGQQCG